MGLQAERNGGWRLDCSLPQASLKAGRPGDRGLADYRETREARERKGEQGEAGCLSQGGASIGPVNTSINEFLHAFSPFLNTILLRDPDPGIWSAQFLTDPV